MIATGLPCATSDRTPSRKGIWAGTATAEDWEAITPFTHGRWDAATQAEHAPERTTRNDEAAATYYADGAVDVSATRTAVADLAAPVLVVAGEYDVALPPGPAAELAAMFGNASPVVLPRAGHTPWADDARGFTRTLARFLEVTPASGSTSPS